MLPEPPAGVEPVVRFRNPTDGTVAWNDLVKGAIEIDNREWELGRRSSRPHYPE